MDRRRRGSTGIPVRLNITIILGPFQPLPPRGIGAVEKVWYQLAPEFQRAGNNVSLIAKGDSIDTRSVAGIQIVPLKGYEASGHLWFDLLTDFLWALKVRHHVGPADVIVTNSFWTPVVLGFSKKRARVIVHVARFPKRQMWLYARADVLQAISSAVAAEISRQTPAAAAKVRVVPYPVAVEKYARNNAPSPSHPTILYVGRVHPEKGLDLLLNAFRIVSDTVAGVRLKIVGPVDVRSGGGGSGYVQQLMSLARGLPVDFEQPIADEASLAQTLGTAQCFCYPSLAERGEAFGLAVLEAMAASLPVVVSDLKCFRDFVSDGDEGLIFDHRGPRAEVRLAEALVRILTNPELASSMARKSAERAQRYAMSAVAQQYLDMFASVCGAS